MTDHAIIVEEADRLADDIVVIDHGRVIARGDARELNPVGYSIVWIVAIIVICAPLAVRACQKRTAE